MRKLWRPAMAAFLAVSAVLLAPGFAATEKPQATAPLYGRNYAVIAPLYTGADGNLSFIRLANDGAAASSFIVTVVGSPTGKIYGSATIRVAAGASPQYVVSDILTQAKAAALNGGDTTYAFYLQDSDQVGYQHVIYSSGSGFFENASVCEYTLPAGPAILRNVHTSRLASYPAQISIHNYYNAALTYQVQVLDSATGTVIGTVPFTAAANATYLLPEQYFEQQLNWAPTAAQQHASLVFTAPGISPAPVLVSDLVYNQGLSAYVNMSAICAVNDNGGNCINDPNGLNHGCVKGSNIAGGTFGNTATVTLLLTEAGNGEVDISPQQTSCANGSQCSLLLSAGATVTLTPNPNAGADFLGWSGACSGTDTCTLTVTASTSATATFSSTGF